MPRRGTKAPAAWRFLRAQTEPAVAIGELAHIVEKRGEDLTDWIAAMQYSADSAGEMASHALAPVAGGGAYLGRSTRPGVDGGGHAGPGRFARIPHGRVSPSAAYMPADDARPGLDTALRRKVPVSARNLFLAARMRVSRDWDELLRYAPRTAAGTFTVGLGEEQAKASALDFDDDGARILDRETPLAALGLAAKNSRLPPNLRLQIARAVWAKRAFQMLHSRYAKTEAARITPYWYGASSR